MPLRPPAGFISAFYDPLKVADAPTIGTATAGDAQASVTFTAPSNVGGAAITQYYAVSNPNQTTGNAASSPVTVTGLTNGTAYTFRVWALNSYGPSPYSAATGSVSPVATRGLFAGGGSPTATNVIQYVTVSSTGDATDFGDLTGGGYSTGMVSCSSSTRAVWRYGSTSSTSLVYSTINTLGNATAFGDLTVARSVNTSFSNSTRGLFAGGTTGAGNNTIDYITIATTGNATDFGDTTVASWSGSGACASSTRGIVEAAGIQSGGTVEVNTVDYVTIATTGNATNFGQLTQSRYGLAGSSSSTRGIFGGGYATSASGYVNTIDYITIATTGNGTDFGDLTVSRGFLSACSSNTRGLFGGGNGPVNVIDYVTISTIGNATDFGDLLAATSSLTACSSGHGGLS